MALMVIGLRKSIFPYLDVRRLIIFVYITFLLLRVFDALNIIEVKTSFDNFNSICIVNNISGFQCPLCGLTRGFFAMTQLNIAIAFQYNIFSPLLFVVGLLFSIYPKCLEGFVGYRSLKELFLVALILYGTLRNIL